ncbi:DUF305 domain-containing protein [Jatrophihabitans sp.]|jgi:uncharacterized protein (DUF305 family)|uniref:DUF305 domain-containing protein n=1 Tax=Jatrophihabitans sp. TaxID=1932789 RepID=UPI0038CD8404
MVVSTELPPSAEQDETPPAGSGWPLRTLLLAVLGVALLALASGVGYIAGHRTGSATPDAGSVDAGFTWDMAFHHRQAVTMAGYTRDNSTGAIRTLAYDIETSQYNQVGQFQGWLDTWGLPPQNPGTPMSWMSHGHGMAMESAGPDDPMPGMATQAEIGKLQTMTGKPLEVYFLQLMLRHHQGGLEMAQYGADHAGESYVRNAAQKIADAQSGEVVLMERMLRERGASPLPPPS